MSTKATGTSRTSETARTTVATSVPSAGTAESTAATTRAATTRTWHNAFLPVKDIAVLYPRWKQMSIPYTYKIFAHAPSWRLIFWVLLRMMV